jgi:hypothetical protein
MQKSLAKQRPKRNKSFLRNCKTIKKIEDFSIKYSTLRKLSRLLLCNYGGLPVHWKACQIIDSYVCGIGVYEMICKQSITRHLWPSGRHLVKMYLLFVKQVLNVDVTVSTYFWPNTVVRLSHWSRVSRWFFGPTMAIHFTLFGYA